MKKNKLYTANKWNQPAFMPKENLFPNGGDVWGNLAKADYNNQLLDNNIGNSVYAGAQNAQDVTNAYMNSTNAFGISKAANPFSKGNLAAAFGKQGLASAASGLASAGIGMLGNAVGSIGGGLIGGGLQSGAGSAISNIGGAVGSAVGTVNPVLGAAVSAASGIIGGLTNRAFGSKLNEEKIAEIEEKQKKREAENNALFGAKSTAALTELAGNLSTANNFTAGDVGEDGWFSDDAEEKYRQLKAEEERVSKLQELALANATDNVNENNFLTSARNSIYSFGGSLNGIKKGNRMNRMTQMPIFMNNFALGGDVQIHGADFSTGLSHIDTGGSHEENPNDGVQMGVDNEGTPNLVEEGETVWNDYVFSNRILADEATKQMFKLPKKKDVTFADISKKLEKEITERPNDPISKAGFEAQMQTLEEQQERQKSEMETERARAAFEALSPEEQTAVMQNAAQQEAMAQQAAQEQAIAEQQAMQQPSPEEVAMMQQQADGTKANIGQVPVMAEGGHLYKDGGSWDWDTLFTMVNDFSKQRGNNASRYKIDTSYDGDIKALEGSDAYKNFTDYILNKATDDERLNYFKWIDNNTGRINKYIKDGKLRADWKENYEAARNDGKYGIQHYNPTWLAAKEAAPAVEEKPAYEPQTYHAMDGDDYDGYIEGELDPTVVGAETRRETLPNGDTVIYHDKAKALAVPSSEEEGPGIEPAKKADWMRYAGLFGPAVGLGMQMAGIGKPDYSRLDAAVANAGKVNLAGYKPIGDYLTYRPMDIWYEQNRMDANARATDRAIQNNAGPLGTKMAGLLANGYNSQLASGELYRKALEYNDAKRKDVAEFNRGTNKYNADAYNRNQEFNATALNHGNQFQQGLAMQAAQERLNRDAGWYNGIYGNVGQLFKGISDLGRENRETNWRNALVTAGAFGAMDEDALVNAGIAKYKKGRKSSEGGTIKRKKGKRGLTY